LITTDGEGRGVTVKGSGMSIITEGLFRADTLEDVVGAMPREVTGKAVRGKEGFRSVSGVGGFSGIT